MFLADYRSHGYADIEDLLCDSIALTSSFLRLLPSNATTRLCMPSGSYAVIATILTFSLPQKRLQSYQKLIATYLLSQRELRAF